MEDGLSSAQGGITSTVLISLLRCLLLLVTLELNEVLIAALLSLLAEINIWALVDLLQQSSYR